MATDKIIKVSKSTLPDVKMVVRVVLPASNKKFRLLLEAEAQYQYDKRVRYAGISKKPAVNVNVTTSVKLKNITAQDWQSLKGWTVYLADAILTPTVWINEEA